MTFGSTLSAGCATRMTGTPSSSQTTVLGEWRPPPSVAIFQFRSCSAHGIAGPTLGPPGPAVCRPVAHAGAGPARGDLDGNGMATRRGSVRARSRKRCGADADSSGHPRSFHQARHAANRPGRPRRLTPIRWPPGQETARSHRGRESTGPPMSMYTQLLDAAFGPARAGTWCGRRDRARSTRRGAVAGSSGRTSRRHGARRGAGGARPQIGYDVACSSWPRSGGSRRIRAASNSPDWSEPGWNRHCGIERVTLRTIDRLCRTASPVQAEVRRATGGQVPVGVAARPASDRSLRRAAKVAAWVRRSMPSFASRFET